LFDLIPQIQVFAGRFQIFCFVIQVINGALLTSNVQLLHLIKEQQEIFVNHLCPMMHNTEHTLALSN
jgi:hypothetical protein